MAFDSIKTKSQGMEIMADKEEDRISDLPDDILSHILSFLELREAVKTTVLSKRWEKVWTSIHRVRLDNKSCLRDFYRDLFHGCASREQEDKRRTSFINFVNGVLTGNNSKLSVTSFSLSYGFGFSLSREIQCLTEWIAAVVTPKLQNFDFSIGDGYMYLSIIPLPPTLFECQKLEILKLNCKDSGVGILLDVPKTARLSRLAKLHLVGVQLDDKNSMKNLLSGCPVLEELVMEEIKLSDNDNKNLFVFSRSLKILRVETYNEATSPRLGCCYVVEAPKLEYLDLVSDSLLGFSMSSSASLVSAVIDISTLLSTPSPSSVDELFRCISNVQKLELSSFDIFISEHELVNLPIFHNLIHLKIRRGRINIHIVNCILQKSLSLKHLVLKDHFVSEPFMWSQPNSVPKCLELHLETIKIIVRFNIEDAMKIIEYFLDKGKVLKKMTITSSFSNEKAFHSRLMGFPRASVGCKIEVSTLPEMSDFLSDYSD